MTPLLLKAVSRTFALTIPLLPSPLSSVVSDAYLVFRLLDTIEDEKGLSYPLREEFIHRWLALLSKQEKPDKKEIDQFSRELNIRLIHSATKYERELVNCSFQLVERIFQLEKVQKEAIIKTAYVMGEGMLEFQKKQTIDSLEELERYCYFVAGCIGELLTTLFEIDRQHASLGRSFGIGLQLTNILKDVEEDQQRGVSWIPSSYQKEEGLFSIYAKAKYHLHRSVDYIITIPKKKRSIRRFCYLTLILSFLTLRALKKGKKKVSKKAVYFAYFFSKIAARFNWMVRFCKKL